MRTFSAFCLVFFLCLGCVEIPKFSHRSTIDMKTNNGAIVFIVVDFPNVIVNSRKELEAVVKDLELVIARLEGLTFEFKGKFQDPMTFNIELSNSSGKLDKVTIEVQTVQAENQYQLDKGLAMFRTLKQDLEEILMSFPVEETKK